MTHIKMPFYALALAIASLTAQADDSTPMRVALKIEPQPVRAALKELSAQSGVQVLLRVDNISLDGVLAPKVEGELTVQAALNRLLQNTGLTYEFVNDRTVRISAAAGQPSRANSSTNESDNPLAGPRAQGASPRTGMQSAQNEMGGAPGASSQRSEKLEEIVVTAQKREERLQDVPVPVTAISAQALVDTHQLRLQDYYNHIPGLNVATSSVGGYQLLSIRGITTGLANPSVGVTIDDVPVGSSTLYGGNVPPDIDPGELSRVEVLRGPQGTLYGASSIGGLIKFVTADPSTAALNGNVQAGMSSIDNGTGVGYNTRVSANVPLSESLAFRASAFARKDPGYIDNPVLHINGINKNDAYGGHFAALWTPSEDFSLKLSAIVQELKADGSPDEDKDINGYPGPPLGPREQNYVPAAGAYETRIQLYSATIKAKLGQVDVTSVTGYGINNYQSTIDFSAYYGGPGGFVDTGVPGTAFNGFGVTGAPTTSNARTGKFTQELRLSGSLSSAIDWLAGGFFTHENNSPYITDINAVNSTTGEVAGLFGEFNQPSTYKEYAGFTDLTFHVTDHFDLQVGARESQIRQTNQETNTGPFVTALELQESPQVGPEFVSKENAFTYLVTPQYKFSPELMAYARVASGYRAGGPNPAFGVPPQYAPDKTYNYELGVKGDRWGHKLSFDASVYYIEWKDIQVSLFSQMTGLSWTANAGAAKSQGVELAIDFRPIEGLKIGSWFAWNEAQLTQSFPPEAAVAGNYAVDGDRLPYAARLTGNLSVEDSFPIAKEVMGLVGGTISYVGDRIGPFTATAAREDYPAYTQTNLRAGLRYNLWSVTVFANNVFDVRGLLDGGLGTNIIYDYHYIQPRTIGFSVAKSF